MARLTIVVEVPDTVDPTLADPHEIADEVLDLVRVREWQGCAEFVGAEWGDHLPEPATGMKLCVRPTCEEG